MTGKGILEALSFVDEQYIDEAENGTLRRISFVWKILPLAACLCIALLGLLPKAETEAIPQQENMDGNRVHGDAEIVVQEKAESDLVMDEAEMEAPTVSELPSVILRIDEWLDTGFRGTVVELPIPDLFELGSQFTVIPCQNPDHFVFSRRISEKISVLEDRIPTPEELPVGSIVLVQFYVRDEENATLYINWITSDLREWED